MKRVAITSPKSGLWFDADKAEKFEEKSFWNGSNHVSKATGSQWEHECLFVTKSGKFILNHWSQYQGIPEKYEIISKERAARWFAKQEFEDDEIPDVFKEEVASLEID